MESKESNESNESKESNELNKLKEKLKSKELMISTSTVTSYINRNVDLVYMSRFIPIFDINDEQLNKKKGGVFHLEYVNDYCRSNLDPEIIKTLKLLKSKKKEFNNQATINFKYWNFRKINIKIFTNGRLQITGIKNESETEFASNLLVNYLSNITIPIYIDIKPDITHIKNYSNPNKT